MARKDLLKGPMEGTGPTDPARLLRYDRGAIGAVSQSINDLRSRAIIDVHADMIDDAVLGKSPLERLDQLGRSFVVTESMGIVQNGIGDLGAGTGAKWEGSLPHLLLHGGVGCVALPAMDGQCDAGFFAGAAQSVLAGSELSDQDKQSLASLVGSMAGYLVDDGSAINVSFGGAVAIEGLANNACSHKEGGCRTTKEEKALADVGDFAACYKLACKGGDLYACNAVYISTKSLGEYWEAKFNSIWSGMSANTPASLGLVSSMYEMDQLAKAMSLSCFANKKIAIDFEKDNGLAITDNELDDIRSGLARRHASLFSSSAEVARWPKFIEISNYHWEIFGKHSMNPSSFGGTPSFSEDGTPEYSFPQIWCPTCVYP